jgi:hypothetical protein
MAASAAVDFWSPRTLTDGLNDITTVKSQPSAAGLTPRDVINQEYAIMELNVESGFRSRRMRLRVPAAGPAWLKPTITRAANLLALPTNWDKFGAPRIEPTAIQNAIDTLSLFMADRSSLPQWTPTRNGGVQLDWHERGIDLEIAFERDRPDGYAVFSDLENPDDDWDGSVNQQLQRMRVLFSERLIRE